MGATKAARSDAAGAGVGAGAGAGLRHRLLVVAEVAAGTGRRRRRTRRHATAGHTESLPRRPRLPPTLYTAGGACQILPAMPRHRQLHTHFEPFSSEYMELL
jgi:hypothetical protein